MKKISILLCLLMILAICTPAYAASPKIVDKADLLTDSQEAVLASKAEALTDEYAMDVVILTVDSLGYKSATAYADDYFDYNGYGIGPRKSGVLFLISMENRDWAISTCGDAIDALTDYGLDKLFETISDDLSDNDFYSAFSTYLTELDTYFEAYEEGSPIDKEVTPLDMIPVVLISLVLGLIVAAIVIWFMTRSMNTARAQRSAQSYVTPGSFDLRNRQDIYLYSHTSRVRRAESSSGGSSIHRSSSGRSHGGRSGKF